MDSQSSPDDEPKAADALIDPLRLRDWLWRPWYAKLWWASVPIYWGGRMASIKVAALASLYDTLVAGYLSVFCNPLIILLLLGFGFIRATLDRGEWVITPGAVHMEGPVHIGRRPGELLDPYTDFTDPRSGIRYLDHRGLLGDHDH